MLADPSDPLLGGVGKRQLLGASFKVKRQTKHTHATCFYLCGAGSAVEDGCSSACSSVVALSRGLSELGEEEAGAGGAVVLLAEAAVGEGCGAAGAVLGWRISNT